jgi:hypothetical protein
VLDFRVDDDNVEPICKVLNRRKVPFIFFTGLAGRLSDYWAATLVVPKPADPAEIVGALKFVLSPDTRDIIVHRSCNAVSDRVPSCQTVVGRLLKFKARRIIRQPRASAMSPKMQVVRSLSSDVRTAEGLAALIDAMITRIFGIVRHLKLAVYRCAPA